MRRQPGKCSSAGASSSGKLSACGGSRSCPCLADEFPPPQEAPLVSAAASPQGWESRELSRGGDRRGHNARAPVWYAALDPTQILPASKRCSNTFSERLSI